MIYEYVYRDFTYGISQSHVYHEPTEPYRPYAFALLRVSRQVHAETSLLPYKLGKLCLGRFPTKFLLKRGPTEKSAAVRRVQFPVDLVDRLGVPRVLPRNYEEMRAAFVGVVDMEILVCRWTTRDIFQRQHVTLLLELRDDLLRDMRGLKKVTFKTVSTPDQGADEGVDIVKMLEERMIIAD